MKATEKKQLLLYRLDIAVYKEHSDSHFISILSLIRQYCHTKEIIKLVFYHILSSIYLYVRIHTVQTTHFGRGSI